MKTYQIEASTDSGLIGSVLVLGQNPYHAFGQFQQTAGIETDNSQDIGSDNNPCVRFISGLGKQQTRYYVKPYVTE